MEWNATWNDPLTSYLEAFENLIGDQQSLPTVSNDRCHTQSKEQVPMTFVTPTSRQTSLPFDPQHSYTLLITY